MAHRKEKKKLLFKLARILSWVFISLILLFLAGSGIFYLYRDSIAKELLLNLNKNQNGKIGFAEISISPFVHFPSVSVRLHEFRYLEVLPKDSLTYVDTIAALQDVYAAIYISDLLKGKINVSKITLKRGKIRLVKNPDSTINLLNALGITPSTEYPADSPALLKQVDTIAPGKEPDINLDGIALNNVSLEFVDFKPGRHSEVDITEMKASVQIQQNIISIGLVSDFLLKNLAINDKIRLHNKILQINSIIVYDLQKKILHISKGEIMLEELKFNISGEIDVSEKQDVNLRIDGDFKDVHLFKLFLSEYGLKHLRSGEIYFNGTVRGSYNDAIPLMEFNFGLHDISLSLPKARRSISDLNLQGYFNSGIKSDFSGARLQIKNLSGLLPEGYINARLSVNNFVAPSINLFWDMKTDVTGFDEIFNTHNIESLHGSITLHNELIGAYNPENGNFEKEKGRLLLLLDSLAFNIPGVMQVKNLSGEVRNNMDTLLLSDVIFNANNTDLTINGVIINLNNLLINEETDIWADLKIKSDTFDLPAIFSYDPRIGNSFPYKIKDVYMNVLARSSTSKLKKFKYNPEIIFEIDQMFATIEDLFPPIFIDKGTMVLSEKNDRIHLDFKEFDIELEQAKLFANVEYYSPPNDPDIVNIDVKIDALNPGKLIPWQEDSIPPFANGILQGFITTKLEIGTDTIDFKTFSLTSDKLIYTSQKDSFDIEQLNIQARNVYYSSRDQTHIFNTLNADVQLQSGKMNSKHFKVEEVFYDIKARNGILTVIPQKNQVFGKEGNGTIKLSPFKDVPVYEIKYTVNQFRIDDFMENMLSDTILTGKMDIDIDVTLTKSEPGNIFSNMDGYIHLTGKDMNLHGLDIDKMIEKYNRSQKFSLVDVGAVAIAGPVGLALTKGSEFANLALGSIGEVTPITSFISEWEITNGKIMLKDVAFATEKNRIAGIGWIDLTTDSLEVTIAVLDKNGCSILNQTLFGAIDSLQQSEIKIMSTVFGPVTNLIDGALGKDCEIIYNGKLTQPPKKTKNKDSQ